MQFGETSRQMASGQQLREIKIQQNIQSTSVKSESVFQCQKSTLIIIILILVGAGIFFFSSTELSSTQIPRRLWVYSANQQESEEMQSWLEDNLENFAGKSGFEVHKITTNNYQKFISGSRISSLSKLTEKINTLLDSKNSPTSKFTKEGHLLLRQLIALEVLLNNGGAIMTDDLVLTEDITWIDRVDQNPYVVRREKGNTEVVGFFDPRFSYPKHREDSDDRIHAPHRYLWQVPAVSCSFLASIPNSQFINKLVEEVTATLENLEAKVQQLHSLAKNQQHKDWREGYQLFTGISRLVLEERARQLKDNQLPVDSFGVSLINVFYGPAKILQQFQQLDHHRLLHYLTNLSQKQLSVYLGALPYAQHLPRKFQPHTFENIQKRDRYIMQGSFFAKLFPKTTSKRLYSNVEDSLVNHNATQWDKLPKRIWMISKEGLDASPLVDRIAYAVAVKVAKKSGFEVNLVEFKKCKKFSDEATCTKIEKAVKDSKSRSETTYSDLLRLAVLNKHGGVYMDTSTILRGDLEWLLDVAKLPSEYVFNRYTTMPRILTMFQAFQGGPGRWKFDPMYNTKTFRHVGLDNSFIAVEKGHELIRQWLGLTLQLLQKNYKQISSVLDKCGVINYRYTQKDNTQGLPLDVMSCVVWRREQKLAKDINRNFINAYHYYGYWQLNGFLGAQKYRLYQNLEGLEMSNNPFFTEYSEEYVNGLIGKPLTPYTKIVSHAVAETSKLLEQSISNLHPESFLARVLSQNRLELKNDEGKVTVVSVEN